MLTQPDQFSSPVAQQPQDHSFDEAAYTGDAQFSVQLLLGTHTACLFDVLLRTVPDMLHAVEFSQHPCLYREGASQLSATM